MTVMVQETENKPGFGHWGLDMRGWSKDTKGVKLTGLGSLCKEGEG